MSNMNKITTSSADLNTYVDRFVTVYKKSAKNVIELATIIGEAHTNFDKSGFKDFCDAIGYDTRSAYVSKMKTIFINLDRFKGVTEGLPGNYTTIYDLARMPLGEFEELRMNGDIRPTMLAPTIAKKTPLKTPSKEVFVKVKWNHLSIMGLVALQKVLNGFDQKWGCTIDYPDCVQVSEVSAEDQQELNTALAANDVTVSVAA
jgi:hypothetical protein